MAKRSLPAKAAPFKFKKGQSGNPNGGRAHSPAIRALKNLTVDTYREVIELVLTGNLAALKAMVEHPDTPAVQVGVATAFMKAIKNGDYGVIERIAERIVGKIPDVVQVTNNTNLNATVAAVTEETLRAKLIKIRNEV